jgi:acyl carrier protein
MNIDINAGKRETLEWIAQAMNVSPDEVELDKPFAEMGLDSLDVAHMIATVEAIIQQDLPENVLLKVRCVRDMFAMMSDRVDESADGAAAIGTGVVPHQSSGGTGRQVETLGASHRTVKDVVAVC